MLASLIVRVTGIGTGAVHGRGSGAAARWPTTASACAQTPRQPPRRQRRRERAHLGRVDLAASPPILSSLGARAPGDAAGDQVQRARHRKAPPPTRPLPHSIDAHQQQDQQRQQCANDARAAKQRALWADPAYRERVLAKRRAADAVRRQSASLAARWADAEYRARVSAAMRRDGHRTAWNKHARMSESARRKMSVARTGRRHSLETRRKISEARRGAARLSSERRAAMHEARSGRQPAMYDRWKRQFVALATDLKLFSDGFMSAYGRRPRLARDIESGGGGGGGGMMRTPARVTPTVLLKCRRYVELKRRIRAYDTAFTADADQVLIDDHDRGNGSGSGAGHAADSRRPESGGA